MSNTAVSAPWASSGPISYRPAAPSDCISIFPELREQDRLALSLSSGDNTAAILIKSVEVSSEAWLAETAEGESLGLFGVAKRHGMGVPWVVVTPAVGRHRGEMLEDGRAWVQAAVAEHGALCNVVHAENAHAIDWLRELGFNLGVTIEQYGAAQVPFVAFYAGEVRNV